MAKCIVLHAFNQEGKVKAISCGLWKCPVCQKNLARLWAKRAYIQVARSDEKYYFITFTMGSDYFEPKTAFAELPKLWNTLRMAIQRFYGKSVKWSYLAFVEGQPKRVNMPHFHIISNMKMPDKHLVWNKKANGWVERKWRIKDFAVAYGFGHQAEQDELNGDKAYEYVAKYASKGSPDMPKNFRRCRPSKDWARLPELEGDTLYVKAKKENLTDYFMRVSDETGIDTDDLWDRWKQAKRIEAY